jgi:hypothetical protein
VPIPRIKHGEKQTLDTLICEEALLLVKFLRRERNSWVPCLPSIYRRFFYANLVTAEEFMVKQGRFGCECLVWLLLLWL